MRQRLPRGPGSKLPEGGHSASARARGPAARGGSVAHARTRTHARTYTLPRARARAHTHTSTHIGRHRHRHRPPGHLHRRRPWRRRSKVRPVGPRPGRAAGSPGGPTGRLSEGRGSRSRWGGDWDPQGPSSAPGYPTGSTGIVKVVPARLIWLFNLNTIALNLFVRSSCHSQSERAHKGGGVASDEAS